MSTLQSINPRINTDKPKVGSVFVSNYPPYNTWNGDTIPFITKALQTHRETEEPLGLYVHVPFCRKRCDFCWYKVSVKKEDIAKMREYIEALLEELGIYMRCPVFTSRAPQHIHFGGGTPSLMSTKDLVYFFEGIYKIIPREKLREITLECEPGTLTRKKVRLLRDLGVTRISLGVQTLEDSVLLDNGRLHSSKESLRAMEWVKQEEFPATNIDLLAGLPGETDESWWHSVSNILGYRPEGVSFYQLELPGNTLYAGDIQAGSSLLAPDWPTKHRWVSNALDAFLGVGYSISDSRSVTLFPERINAAPSLYQDGLNRGLDLISIGASPFGLVGNTQYQNEKSLPAYLSRVQSGALPYVRGCVMDTQTQFLREVILGLKTGVLDLNPLEDKFALNPLSELGTEIKALEDDGLLSFSENSIVLTRRGLLEVDFWLPRLWQ